jgi:4-hydroxy-2-oxoheptanedioate aldolase
MPSTNLRERIHDRTRPPLPIVPITLPVPALVEIVGFAGAEAVLIDAEHGAIGPETMRSMLAHAQSANAAAVFRPRSFDAAACRQALDAGAAGVHVSHVDTAEEAQAVVKACRYAPLGQREMSLGRAVQYDASRIPAYVNAANDSQLLVVMIESPIALENVDAIAAVAGVDVLHMGTADLTHSLGYALGDTKSKPAIREAIHQVIAAANRRGVTVGIPTDAPAEVEYWSGHGVRYFEMDAPDYVLRHTYAERLAAFRSACR